MGDAAPLRRGRLPAISSGSLALALGAATCAAVATAVSAFSVADRLHGTPVHAPGNWQSALSISVIAGFASYVGALLLVSRSGLPVRPALTIGAAIQAFPLLGPWYAFLGLGCPRPTSGTRPDACSR